MSIERHDTGDRMSQAVVHGDTVYLAGQVGFESRHKSAEEQTREILDRIDRHLAAAGSDKSKLLSATIWLSDMRLYDAMNAEWDAWVPKGQAPARACVEARLAAPGFDVEIMVTAAR